MTDMEAYLLKASAILALFLLVYQALLRRETFFRVNRFFLLSGIFAALLLPLVTLREEVAIPLELMAGTPASAMPDMDNTESRAGLRTLLFGAYLLGMLFFLGRTARQLLGVLKLMKGPRSIRKDGVVLRPTEQVGAPFSFLKHIFYNPKAHDPAEFQQILEHEKVHARQWHTLDILLARAAAVALWLNPLAWIYQKTIQENLEYLADAGALRHLPSPREYQYTLLKVSGNPMSPSLVNAFNSPILKKRIVMLHQTPSKTIHLLKYLLIVPALALFLMAFNRETVYVPQLDSAQELITPGEKTIEVTIDKNTSDAELLELKEKMAKDGIDFSYTTVRNGAGEIIDLSFNFSGKAENGNPFSGSYNSDSEEPIKPVLIYINSEGGVFFGEASTYRKFSSGKEVHFTTGSGEKMIWVQRSGEEDGPLFGTRMAPGNQVIIVDGKEVDEEKGEKAYLRQLEEREKMMILTMEDAKTIEVREKDGEKVILVDGKEVSREELREQGEANKIFIKMLETDNTSEADIQIHNIEVQEDGKSERIIRMSPDAKDSVRYRAIVIDSEKSGDFPHGKQSKMSFYSTGNNPLIFIDGKKASKKDMKALAPDQIESINVLKGEAALEKYGKKAAEGVIEITTKKQ